jgi:hypothetical protein
MDTAIIAAVLASATSVTVCILEHVIAPRLRRAKPAGSQGPKHSLGVFGIWGILALLVGTVVYFMWPFLARPDRVSLDEDRIRQVQEEHGLGVALNSSLIENIALKSLLSKSRDDNPAVRAIHTLFLDVRVSALELRYYKLQFITKAPQGSGPLHVRGLSRPSASGARVLEWLFPYDSKLPDVQNGQAGTVKYLSVREITEPSALIAATYQSSFDEFDWIIVEIDDFTKFAPVGTATVGIAHLSLGDINEGSETNVSISDTYEILQERDEVTLVQPKLKPAYRVARFGSIPEYNDMRNAIRDLSENPNLLRVPKGDATVFSEIKLFEKTLKVLATKNPLVSYVALHDESSDILSFVTISRP